MKNLKFILSIALTILLLVSCGEDRSVATFDTNHRIIVTSEMDFENKVAIGGHIDFGDISRGVVSRLWTMPGGTDVSVIAENGASTSSKPVIKGVFYKPGVYNVTLNQTFGGDVYPNDDSTEPLNTRELDTTIVVTVLDSLRANLKIYYINEDGTTGDELILADDAQNELTASKSVRLTFTAVGEPDNVTWTSNGGRPNRIQTELNEVDMRFNKLGSWDIDFLASRFRPRDADTISFEKIIKVIPSTEPVVLESVYESEGSVALSFSRDMDLASLNASNFSVRLENGSTILNPSVANATLDSNENNVVLLELDGERMYDNDIAYVTYNAGSLRTADQVDADSFTDVMSTSAGANPNIYETIAPNFDYGFESTNAGNWPYQFWGGLWGEYDMEINSTNPRSDSRSMYIEYRPFGGMIIAGSGNFQLQVGQEYEIGYWIYIVDGIANAPTGTAASDIRFYANNWAMGDWATTVFDSGMPTGEWIYQNFYFKSTTDASITWLIRGFNENNADTLRFYIDDMSLSEVELRP